MCCSILLKDEFHGRQIKHRDHDLDCEQNFQMYLMLCLIKVRSFDLDKQTKEANC